MGRVRRHWKGLLATVVVIVAALAIGVPYLYIHVVEGDQPAPLGLDDAPTSSAPGGGTAQDTASIAGTWKITSGSRAGYRVQETLAGQGTTAVGRTSKVTGSLTVRGTSVTAARFSVPVADITSDRSQRDEQFRGRIMDAAQYPTASFRLTRPIALGSAPAVGEQIRAEATGELTMHGQKQPVTFPVEAERTSSGLAVTGDIDVAYADYGIDNPSFGNFVSVGDEGTVEFLLIADRSAG